jgi:hypothetical protein
MTEIARVIGQTLVIEDIAVDMIPPAAQSMEQDPADVIRIRQDIRVQGHRMFAGKLNSHTLGVAQRASLLVCRDMSEGDFRDWAVITRWADGIAADLAAVNARPAPAGPVGGRLRDRTKVPGPVAVGVVSVKGETTTRSDDGCRW